MPLKVIEETVEKDVSFLEDVNVKFVSLVRHGANQMPFRVVKSDMKGGGQSDMMVIQSILVPKHLELEDLVAEKDEMAWLSEARTEKSQDFDEYRRFDQINVEHFQNETLKMVKIHQDGVWALVGVLKEGEAVKGAISLGAKEVSAAKEVPAAPTDSQVPGVSTAAAAAASFRDMFYKELDNMLNVVTGTLNQKSGAFPKRKSSILNAVDAFRSFLVIGLDAVGDQSAKIEKIAKTDMEEENMELFKTKEEFTAAVGEMISSAVPGIVSEAVAQLQKAASEVEAAKADSADPAVSAEKDESVARLAEKVDSIVAAVAELTKKWDNGLSTEPAGGKVEEPARKSDSTDPNSTDVKAKAKKSVFAGLLTSQ